MAEDDHEEPHIHAMPLSALLDSAKDAREAHDRAHMNRDALINRIYAYLDRASKEDLLVLREMLVMDPKSWSNNYFEGQIVSILRLAHHVDPDTGLTEAETLANLTETGNEPS
jgi:hypothetical protein